MRNATQPQRGHRSRRGLVGDGGLQTASKEAHSKQRTSHAREGLREGESVGTAGACKREQRGAGRGGGRGRHSIGMVVREAAPWEGEGGGRGGVTQS